jgi:signal transduction histidine kinase/CheY-like chemotaxis protein
LEGDLLCVRGQWAAPADLKKEDAAQGHICFDVISRDSDHPLVVRNLQDTNYAKTDPNVAAYGLRTYVGCRVRYGGNARGSLCTVYTRDCAPSSDDLDVMSIIASAIANEEERLETGQKLRQSEEERLKTQKLEAIGTLAGGIAHDFNNLLQGVFGYISLAKLTADKREKSIAALEQAEKALHQAVSLTTQLLTFSKGGAPLKKVLALRPVIENAAKFALSGSRSYFQLGADDDLWPTEADEGQIGRVIQNIVLNADQAMPEGGKVEITARNVQVPGTDLPPGLRNGRYVEIAIRDSGIGIPEQYLTKIFDPYFTSKDRGSGLGLATSYSIIKNHGGWIEVKSSLGKGSTFLIYLPAVAEQKEEKMSVSEVAPSRSGKVLIMDDEPVVLNVVGELVRALGHEVEFAEHGTVAIEKYSQARASGKPFDVVILDLTIRGGMGGAETVRKLLEIDPEVKAVVSSGYSDADVVSKYREYGFSAFLKKPYKVDDLQDVLTMLIR